MPEPTAEQRASADLARAVFSDPGERAKFEAMARETANREPVSDDFAWLPPRLGGLANGDDRVSLPVDVDPRDVLRALLHTPPSRKD
jgi:hypothetical protein